MDRINLEDTTETLAELVARVENGETIVVARGGDVVARIEPAAGRTEPKTLKPVDLERLRRLTENMTYQEESAGIFMRRLRDDARF